MPRRLNSFQIPGPLQRIALSLASLIGLSVAAPPAVSGENLLVFISASAKGNKGGIHAFEFNTDNGKLTPLQRNAGLEHPFFMALSPDKQFLYSIHAPGKHGGKENEFVVAFKITDDSGKLEELNRQSALGTAACYLDVDATGRSIVVANYSTGSVAALPLKEDGSLEKAATFIQHEGSSIDPKRQEAAHAHAAVISPDNRFMLAPDLGLDKILSYRLDPATAKLTPAETPFTRTAPGAGPRHLIFHPNGKHVYVINELADTVSMFNYDAETSTLDKQQTISTLPEDAEGEKNWTADLKITPDGKHLYATNRGHDSLACFRLGEDGQLTLLKIIPSGGKNPQNLAITPDGRWLLCANMAGNNVRVFLIEPETGTATPVGKPVRLPSPACILVR